MEIAVVMVESYERVAYAVFLKLAAEHKVPGGLFHIQAHSLYLALCALSQQHRKLRLSETSLGRH